MEPGRAKMQEATGRLQEATSRLQEALRKKEAAEDAAVLETHAQIKSHLADLIANLARRAGSFLFGPPPLKINLRMP